MATSSPRRAVRAIARGAEEVRYVQTLGYFANKAGLTLEALTDRTGISRERLSAMIRGRLAIEGSECLILARAVGCAPAELRSGPPIRAGEGGGAGSRIADPDGLPPTRAAVGLAMYELGLRDAPPAEAFTEARTASDEPELNDGDLAAARWSGRTSLRRIFGTAACGWCGRRHLLQEGLSCR